MMDFYRVYTVIRRDGIPVGYWNRECLLETIDESSKDQAMWESLGQTIINDPPINITWENLDDMIEKYNLVLDFRWEKKKKGRVIYFNHKNEYPNKKSQMPIKEWKEPLNLTFQLGFQKLTDTKSLKSVLEWPEVEKTIKFLQERVLTNLKSYDIITTQSRKET